MSLETPAQRGSNYICLGLTEAAAQALLREMEALAEDGQWGELESALQRVQGAPNDAATNLRYAAICVPLLCCGRQSGVPCGTAVGESRMHAQLVRALIDEEVRSKAGWPTIPSF